MNALFNEVLEAVKGFSPEIRFIVLPLCAIFLIFTGILLSKAFSGFNALIFAKNQRKDAVKRSRSVLSGQMKEQIAPFLPGFPCNPSDVRFVGKPVDFVAFPGASENKSISEILLIEVKSGSSQLSGREREIKNAVEKGNVRYVEYRIP